MSSTRSERATAAALVSIGAFQAALAAGAPWGRAAYGGGHSGTLPQHLRTVSAFAAVIYGAGAALIVRGSGSTRLRTRGLTALSLFMGVGIVANGASRSRIERVIWTPITAITALLAWRSRNAQAGRAPA
jgi:lysylphosphatidylglycerol synthetase-like protein (DUF2156 family)